MYRKLLQMQWTDRVTNYKVLDKMRKDLMKDFYYREMVRIYSADLVYLYMGGGWKAV